MSRVIAKGEAYEMDMVLDINSELYPLEVGDKCKVLLANTLKLDGSADGSAFNQVCLILFFVCAVYAYDASVLRLLQSPHLPQSLTTTTEL